MCNNVRVYSCQQEGEGYSLKMIPGEVTVIVDVMLPSEGMDFGTVRIPEAQAIFPSIGSCGKWIAYGGQRGERISFGRCRL